MDTTLLRRFGRKNLGEFGLFETRLGRCNRPHERLPGRKHLKPSKVRLNAFAISG